MTLLVRPEISLATVEAHNQGQHPKIYLFNPAGQWTTTVMTDDS